MVLTVALIVTIQFVLGFGALALACAYSSRCHMRMGLFKRQLSIFEGVQDTFTHFVTHGRIDADSLRFFTSVTAEAPLILGPDIVSLLDEIRSHLLFMAMIEERQQAGDLTSFEQKQLDNAKCRLQRMIDTNALQPLFMKEVHQRSHIGKRVNHIRRKMFPGLPSGATSPSY